MGQKVNPNIIRLGFIKLWHSTWYADKKDFAKNIDNDFKVRQFIHKKLSKALISHIIIERLTKNIRVNIHAARPGLIIGKNGEDIENIRKSLSIITKVPTQINITEIRIPELNSILVAKNISLQLEKRVMFRKIIKRSIQNAMKLGAKGIKIEISGRLGGTEIARTEWYKEGRIPLHTLRADIDYADSKAYTNYGIIGVKVWIFKGEILSKIIKK
ncbi:MAG: 30S ribosomal protein S3 [Candidatus Lightella neohaematopini]|nr:30S ribosomal protein S3 [Candidatus Lightella neohaematopini]